MKKIKMSLFAGGMLAVGMVLPLGAQEGSHPGHDHGEKKKEADLPAPSAEFLKQAETSMERGWKWLAENQREDGSWGARQGDVGITGLAVRALTLSPDRDGKYKDEIEKGVKYLLENRREDGSFVNDDGMVVNYRTSTAMTALIAVDKDKYAEEIEGAKKVIAGGQVTDPANKINYGGFGYVPGDKGRNADMNNTTFALEALNMAEKAGFQVDPQVFQRAQQYVSRIQNLEKTNDTHEELGVSGNDGGFRYRVNETKANAGEPVEREDGTLHYPSYGSMTYAGLMSFIYARVDRDDPRVVAAFNWIRNNYTLEENPGMATPKKPAAEKEGLYYYYHTFAKALEKYGAKGIRTPDGIVHDWAKEWVEKVVNLQEKDGSWINPADRWYEGDKAVVSSYILKGMDHALKELKERK